MPLPLPRKPAAKPAAEKKPKQTPRPGVEVGDLVYFKMGDAHTHGRVVSHGAHGCHIDHDGGRARVYWSDVLGHKERKHRNAEVVDRGEDGVLIRDEAGRTRFVAGEIPEPEPDPREDTPQDHAALISDIHRKTPMAKSIPADSRLLFFKGGPIANRAGLTKKQITDKHGNQTTRWVRTNKEQGGDQQQAAEKPPVEVGHHAKFKAGDHQGEGHVTAVGKDGVTVKDSTGREHQVHHHEIHELNRPLFHPDEVSSLPKKKNQPVKSKEELYAKSQEALGQLKTWLTPICEGLGMKTDAKMDDVDWNSEGHYLFIAPLKGEKRAEEKVNSDYGGDWSQLRDVVRCSVAVDTMDQMHDVLSKLKDAGLKLAMQPKDRFAKPTPVGYRDLLMNIELPNGVIGEMQLHVKGMLEAKEQGHKPYEVMRSIFAKHGEDSDLTSWPDEDQSAFLGAVDDSKKIYGSAWERLAGGEDGNHKATSDAKPAQSDAPNLSKALGFGTIKLPVLLFRKVGV